MITVLILDHNAFYRHSMECYLRTLFADEIQSNIQFFSQVNEDSIRFFDFVILAMHQGEYFICQPERYLCRTGMVIGLVERRPQITTPLPNCLSDMVFIERSAALQQVGETVVDLWRKKSQPFGTRNKLPCVGCRHKSLTPQQERIMSCFSCGKAVPETAEALNMSDKTIFSHKYQVMTKFNLRSDYELVCLLRKLTERGEFPETLVAAME